MREHVKYIFNEECSSDTNENADCSTERSENASFFGGGSTEGPDADIPPYADTLSISGSDDEDATHTQKLGAARPNYNMFEIAVETSPSCFITSDQKTAEWKAFWEELYAVDEGQNDQYASDSDSDAESKTEDIRSDELATQLAQWAVIFNIPSTALSSLLTVLQCYHPLLPKDPRTLKKTPSKTNERLVEGSDGCC